MFTDPCQAQRSVEFLWYFLRMIPRPHIFSTHLSAATKEWMSDNWRVQSKEQQKVEKDSSNAFHIHTELIGKTDTCNPSDLKSKGMKPCCSSKL